MTTGLKNTLPGDPPLIRMFLFGPFAVLGEDGQDLTPRSKKARAVLGMLALAPRGVRTRVWLRHKLWSVKSEDQSSASLRQSLLEIRRILGPAEKRCIQADKNTVALNLDIVDVDYMKAMRAGPDIDRNAFAPEQLLEGLEIADPEFEDWLQKERENWANRLASAGVSRQIDPKSSTDALAPTPAESATSRRQIKLAILPPMLTGQTQAALAMLPQAHRLLASSLTDIGDFKCFEPTGTASQHWSATPYDWMARLDPDTAAAFQFKTFGAHGATQVSLQLQHPTSGRVLWSKSLAPAVNLGTALERHSYEAIAAATDATQTHLLGAFTELREHSVCSNALATMMRLSPTDIDKAEASLSTALEVESSAQLNALMAFLLTFRIGQRFQFEDAALIERAQAHTSSALAQSGGNALVDALTAHVHSYLFGEYDFAAGLFEKALRRNPTQVMAWDLYSMLHAYAGQPRKALAMANWACHLGAQSPNRYYFETTRAITACFSGHHTTALKAGEFALTDRPEFNSILRVLVSSSAHLGQISLAQAYLQRLRKVEPNFTIEALHDAGYPGLETAGGQHFVDGLLKAGVKRA